MNAREAYRADKLPAWVRKGADEIAGPDSRGRLREFVKAITIFGC